MSKVAVVYWTGTGNTQAMAEAVAAGAEEAGDEAEQIFADQFHAADVSKYTSIAFGCPAMGDEVLEESVFQPMWDEVKKSLGGKRVGLFGSWGWGNGAWMNDWQADAEDTGALLEDPVTCCNAPDDAALGECRELGKKLAS